MNYPKKYSSSAEPEEICVGDLVWWNEGVCVGFVEEVIETQTALKSWGLEEHSIALINLHPWLTNKKKGKLSTKCSSSGSIYINSEEQLEDEGVGLLSKNERKEFEWAVLEAKKRVAIEYRDLPFCVFAMTDIKLGVENWHFHFVDSKKELMEEIIFPFRSGTRT